MTRSQAHASGALALLLLVSAHGSAAGGFAPFTVSAIRIEGLQRISEGTVFNLLPVDIGDTLTPRRVREALRAVNDSGFFRDVEMRRDEGGVLIVVVRERPSIRSFEVTGNKDVKTEDLNKSLKNVGLAQGKILNRSTLEDVRQYLIDQYFSRGKYGVRVDANVVEQPGNLVDVKIKIVEGERARIREINVVGNERFTDRELLEGLELKSHNLLSFYKQDDRYSKQTLEGDLEKLRSYYLDRGYADFEITSTQVALAPEKDDLYITVNVFEGKTWKLGAVKLAGRFVIPQEILEQYVRVKPGDLYSQRLIAASEDAIRDKLGEQGFSFAEVHAVPNPDAAKGEIALTFEIEPNSRTYVRRIEFDGVERTRDDVLRREMRQLEGGTLSNALIERSKERLERLPYITTVETSTEKVEGAPDLVDVKVKVEEGPSSQLGGGIGYSQQQSFMLNGSFVDSNLFGSGDRLGVELNGGHYSKIYSVTHTNPYFTADNVSLSLDGSYIERERLTSSYSPFTTTTAEAGASVSYPLSEAEYVNFGITTSHEDLATSILSSTQLRDWVRNNGDSYFRRVGSDTVLGTVLDNVELSAGWLYDSRNRTLFPTRGGMYRFTVTATPPGNTISYATAYLRAQQFFHLPGPDFFEKFPISVSSVIGWSAAFGDTTSVPPHHNVLMGGSDSVRGFRDGTLGPRDSLGNPYGGDSGISTQIDAIVPLPQKFQSSARVSLFFDFGQAYYLGETVFHNPRGDRANYGVKFNELRSSTGISVQWLSPMGLFRFSYAVPIAYQRGTRREFGDVIERFQFSVGQAF